MTSARRRENAQAIDVGAVRGLLAPPRNFRRCVDSPGLASSPCVVLRQFAAEDTGIINAIVADPDVGYWLFCDGRSRRNDRGDVGDLPLGEAVRLQWTAVASNDNRVVGGAQLDGIELSYFVRREDWGRGFGSAIARQACALAKEILREPISLFIHRENIASRRIAERLGFQFVGLKTEWGRRAILHYRERSQRRVPGEILGRALSLSADPLRSNLTTDQTVSGRP